MRENRDFVVPVNILTPFACAPFSWAARHTTACLDLNHASSKVNPTIESFKHAVPAATRTLASYYITIKAKRRVL